LAKVAGLGECFVGVYLDRRYAKVACLGQYFNVQPRPHQCIPLAKL